MSEKHIFILFLVEENTLQASQFLLWTKKEADEIDLQISYKVTNKVLAFFKGHKEKGLQKVKFMVSPRTTRSSSIPFI